MRQLKCQGEDADDTVFAHEAPIAAAHAVFEVGKDLANDRKDRKA